MYHTTLDEYRAEHDIRSLVQTIQENRLLAISSTNRGLINIVTLKRALPEVAHDLLHARTMGQADYETTVKYRYLKDVSVQVPKRKRQLMTFSSKKKLGRKLSTEQKEQRIVTLCTRKSIAWAKTQGQSDDCIGLQFIEEPRALVCSDGTPTKGE